MTVKDVNKQTTLDDLMDSFTEGEETVCQLAMDQVREDGGTSGQQMAACAAAVRGMRGEGDSDDVERSLEVKKNTLNDKRMRMSDAVDSQVPQGYYIDSDDDYIFVRDWQEDQLYRYPYTFENNTFVLGIQERERTAFETFSIAIGDDSTEGEIVQRMKKAEGGIAGFLDKHFSGSRKTHDMVIKQYNDEEMIEYAPLYNPPDSPDLVGDAMSQDTIDSMVTQLNKAIEDGVQLENLGHAAPISKAWKYQEVFTSPWPSCMVGETEVVKGQPVLVTKYFNERAWELRKEGVIKGPSIGGQGTFRKV